MIRAFCVFPCLKIHIYLCVSVCVCVWSNLCVCMIWTDQQPIVITTVQMGALSICHIIWHTASSVLLLLYGTMTHWHIGTLAHIVHRLFSTMGSSGAQKTIICPLQLADNSLQSGYYNVHWRLRRSQLTMELSDYSVVWFKHLPQKVMTVQASI